MFNDVIESRLKKLETILVHLKNFSKYNIVDFQNDFILLSSLEYTLQTAIQCVLDIGNHIISIENLEKPEEYKDIILILGKHDIIPKDFADRIYKMAGLRNILVHDYLNIDIQELVSHLKKIDDFKLFMKIIKAYLEKKAKESK